MEKLFKEKQRTIFTILLLLAWILIGLLIVRTHGGFTAEELVNYQPEDPVLCCLVMLGLFLLKSVDFIMHSGVLYAANGIMFPLPLALLFNLCGAVVMITPTYIIGRSLGPSALKKLIERYPKLEIFQALPAGGSIPLGILLRTVGIPLQAVNLYMGAMQVPFVPYLLSSMIGLFPLLLACTVMGSAASDIRSPAFLIALGIQLVLAAFSVVLYAMLHKKEHKKTSA